MADKTIKVKVDVETDVEPTITALKALKKQLKDTAAGSEEFLRLQQQIDDVQDSLVVARKGAGNFADVISGLPGPVGQLGSQASGLIATLKQFGQLKLSDIQSSFVELGKDLKDAAIGLANLTGLTKIYTVLNNALSKSLIAVGIGEQAAAVGARALSAALIATGIGALVVLIGAAVSMLYEMATGTKAAEEATKRLNDALESQNRLLDLNQKSAANRNKVTLAQMKVAGKSEKEIRDFQIKQSYKDYEAAHAAEVEARALYNKNLGKADAAGLKALEDNLSKREQSTKDARATYLETGYNAKAEELKAEEAIAKELAGKAKSLSDARIAERKRELEELKKGLEEARLTTLGEKQKDLEVVRIKYDELKAKAIKFGEDTKVIEEARAKENIAITEKYAKEDKDTADKLLQDKLTSETLALDLRIAKGEIDETEYQNKLYEIRKQYALSNDDLVKAEVDLEKYKNEQKKLTAEEERAILLNGLQSKFEALDKENARIDGDFEQDLARITQQKEILAEQERIDLENTELTEFQKTEIRKKYGDARIALSDKEVATEQAAMEAKNAINMAYLGLFEQFGNVLGQIAGKNKALAIAGVVISQAAAIGQIISQTAIANAKSVAASPLTAGMPWVAINTISAGLSIVSTIASAVKSIQQINSADAAGTGGGGASAPISASPPPTPPMVSGTAAPQVQTTGGQNPNTQLAETLGKVQAPIKAYVVSGEVSSQQALDRRTSRAATFSGG